jgi:hypothetical protein
MGLAGFQNLFPANGRPSQVGMPTQKQAAGKKFSRRIGERECGAALK